MPIAHRFGYLAPERVMLLGAQAVAPGAVALSLWAAALAAMQPTHALAPHRRLAAGAMVSTAMRLAAWRKGKFGPRPVSGRQHCTGHRVGVAASRFCVRLAPQAGEVEPWGHGAISLGGKLKGGEHEPYITYMVLNVNIATGRLRAAGGRTSLFGRDACVGRRAMIVASLRLGSEARNDAAPVL